VTWCGAGAPLYQFCLGGGALAPLTSSQCLARPRRGRAATEDLRVVVKEHVLGHECFMIGCSHVSRSINAGTRAVHSQPLPSARVSSSTVVSWGLFIWSLGALAGRAGVWGGISRLVAPLLIGKGAILKRGRLQRGT
jgi:hypothetical protein